MLVILTSLLSLVLLTAGIAKLFDISGTQQSLVAFGLRTSFARVLGWLLPIVELLTSIALLHEFTAWWGGVCALCLFVAFDAAIALNLANGRKPVCRCF